MIPEDAVYLINKLEDYEHRITEYERAFSEILRWFAENQDLLDSIPHTFVPEIPQPREEDDSDLLLL